MKKGYLNNFVNWILDKLATKVYNQLATSNKTMIGALNELNNLLKTQIIDTRSTNKPPQYYYSNYPQTVVYLLQILPQLLQLKTGLSTEIEEMMLKLFKQN